ncbi:hypothetical protein VCCP1035_2704A, partial [Vibrio cholerae CP1035(8)]
MLKRMVCPT